MTIKNNFLTENTYSTTEIVRKLRNSLLETNRIKFNIKSDNQFQEALEMVGKNENMKTDDDGDDIHISK